MEVALSSSFSRAGWGCRRNRICDGQGPQKIKFSSKINSDLPAASVSGGRAGSGDVGNVDGDSVQ